MDSPCEPGTPRQGAVPRASLPAGALQSGMLLDNPLEGELLSWQRQGGPFHRDSTRAAGEDSSAASSARSSGRTSSSSSSRADEDEDEEVEEHVLAGLSAGASQSEATSEVFYPAVSHEERGNRQYGGVTPLQDMEDPGQGPSSHLPTSSQDTHDCSTKRPLVPEDVATQSKHEKESLQKGSSVEATRSIELGDAECTGSGTAQSAGIDGFHACSSEEGAPQSHETDDSALTSLKLLQSHASNTDVVDRPSLADASLAFCDSAGSHPIPDTSLTSSSMLPDGHSPETAFRVASCDAAEHSVYLQSYAFNQDYTCFLCATTAGFRVFTCAPLFEFMRRESPAWGEGCYEVAGMLFRTNVFALVSAAEQKKVKLWDDQKKTFIGELRSRQPVRNVCLGREILAVVTEYTVYVYQSEQMRPFSIIHTRPNPRGLCIITSTGEENGWILACPAVAAGAVRVQTPEGDKTSHVFQAHQTPLAVMAFNSRGTLITTASETGTVIRIFCAIDGQLLHELRRGTHTYAVTCLALRADDLFLAVASSSPTVHIFKLEQHEQVQQKHSSELANASAAGSALDPSATNVSPPDVRAAGTCSVAESFTRSNSASSANAAASTACSAAGGVGSSSSGSRASTTTAVPLQQALSVGKELTSVVYDASKEIVHDVIKGVFFKYFSAVRSFAQFHVPVDQQAIDVRSPTSNILGPLCAFAGEISNHLYLLHPNGVFYEFRFDPNYGNECTLLTATTWFAPRPDFQIQSHLTLPSLPSELEGGHEGDEWQIVM